MMCANTVAVSPPAATMASTWVALAAEVAAKAGAMLATVLTALV
jgi:hypothetical protein